ncbi:hypothetical protein B0O99DRAFT_645758 [Bisporella sp. PMI_857]|nr:hypothetical protein B0O99DRAFT_645758 [Bisporella sp. PMI_857]
MSDLSPQTNSQVTYGELPMVAHRVFRCFECEQYVVFPSDLPDAAVACKSTLPLDTSCFETIDKSDRSQESLSYDFNSLQPLISDHSNLIQSVISPSSFQSPFFSFQTDMSQIPFPQVTDISMNRQFPDSYDLPTYTSTITADQKDEMALLRIEIDQLKGMVQLFQQSYTDKMEAAMYVDGLRDGVLQRATSERDNLENRLETIEEYLRSLFPWGVEIAQALDRLKETHKAKRQNKRPIKS